MSELWSIDSDGKLTHVAEDGAIRVISDPVSASYEWTDAEKLAFEAALGQAFGWPKK